MYCGDDTGAIVGAIGHHNSRFGYAGDDKPRVTIESVLGRLTTTEHESKQPASKRSTFIPEPNVRPAMDLVSPLSDSEVTDWDAMERLWQYGCEELMRVDLKAHPVMIGESLYGRASESQREKYLEIMFESFAVPAMYLAKEAVLAAFAAGRSTALVLDIGGATAQAVPVCEGFALHRGFKSSGYGGDGLTKELYNKLTQRQIEIKPLYTFEKKRQRDGSFIIEDKHISGISQAVHLREVLNIVADIKHSACKCSNVPLTADTPIEPVQYDLPDGKKIDIGREIYSVAETLFDPSTEIVDGYPKVMPLHQLVFKALTNVDVDIRRELCNNILLVGGGSLIPGIAQRLHGECSKLISSAFKLRILLAPPAQTRANSWTGGSILASLGSFQQLWISKLQYEEEGARVVETVCP